ncbi:WecB/TagA/CpsF family glycosyltransferase [Algoriphagus vanfongensis]|uniref:WecB/TagA/CpsF family glycosyltransferase n=1 Tax=Algoriphagus vanfongensis TaxID=426371 RepID=UPI0003F9C71B|nr:WecB/TagA/CpsF family glycosyltransferase [Algoriphagus vanfongensis]
MQHKFINGIRVYGFGSKVDLIEFANQRPPVILIAVNAEKIVNSNPQLKEVINANIGYADGVGAVWALKQKGLNNVVKIPGVELWLEFVKNCYKDSSFYFVGGTEPVIQAVVQKIKIEYPGIAIKGYRNGYLKEGDRKLLIKDIEEKKPDFVFVAMGSPAQENLMTEMVKVHAAVYMGLGGSFDVYTEKVKRAPQVFLDFKVEWLYRLLSDPKRITRQLKLVGFVKNMMLKKY